MPKKTKEPEAWSIYQFYSRFPDEESARLHMENMRWNGTPTCPHCGSARCAERKDHKPMPYRCKDCRKDFSVKIGTIFQKAKVSHHKCLLAVYLITTAKKGISSHQLRKHIGCTQKTAWYLGHRIRECMEQNADMLSGTIEVDETFIGGKRKNMSNSRRKALKDTGRGAVGKTAVVGLRERGGGVKATPIASTGKNALQGTIKASVVKGSNVYTDDFRSYQGLEDYNHESVRHSISEYVRDQAHTNGIESFWALLKRGYYGTFHWMSGKHLNRYVDEFSTRFNNRHMSSEQHLNYILFNSQNKKLSYSELINGKSSA